MSAPDTQLSEAVKRLRNVTNDEGLFIPYQDLHADLRTVLSELERLRRPHEGEDLFANTLSAYGRAMYDKGSLGQPLERSPIYNDLIADYRRLRSSPRFDEAGVKAAMDEVRQNP